MTKLSSSVLGHIAEPGIQNTEVEDPEFQVLPPRAAPE